MIPPRIAKNFQWEPQNHNWLRDGSGKKQNQKALGFLVEEEPMWHRTYH